MTGITDTKTDTVFQCSFCNRTFQRENSLMVHLCEQKKRHREKSEVAVQLGLKAYLRFYEITQGSARLKSWDDFVTSAYYRAFVKFGRHCQAVKTINTAAFIDWLINKNVKLSIMIIYCNMCGKKTWPTHCQERSSHPWPGKKKPATRIETIFDMPMTMSYVMTSCLAESLAGSFTTVQADKNFWIASTTNRLP
jgi:hypothetical protein